MEVPARVETRRYCSRRCLSRLRAQGGRRSSFRSAEKRSGDAPRVTGVSRPKTPGAVSTMTSSMNITRKCSPPRRSSSETPTYFTDVSAEMKALLDRAGLVAVANEGLLRGKNRGRGGSGPEEAAGPTPSTPSTICSSCAAPSSPGSTYWNLGYGLEKGDVNADAEGFRNMEDLGRTIAWLGNAMSGHMETYPKAVTAEG